MLASEDTSHSHWLLLASRWKQILRMFPKARKTSPTPTLLKANISTKPTRIGNLLVFLRHVVYLADEWVRLMQMSEIEREGILAQRVEEMQRIQDKRNLDQMLKDQSNRAAEVDSVSKAAKRLRLFGSLSMSTF
jgi:hypothetical protein